MNDLPILYPFVEEEARGGQRLNPEECAVCARQERNG